MALDLPAGLPLPLLEGHTRTDEALYADVAVGRGYPRRRRMRRRAPESATVTWRLSATQAQAWADWYEDELLAGALLMRLPVLSRSAPPVVEYIEARAVSQPQYAVRGFLTDISIEALMSSDSYSFFGSSRVLRSNVLLGTQAALQVSFTAYAVAGVGARGMVSLMRVTPSAAGDWDLVVRDGASPTAAPLLEAYGLTGAYEISAPWYYEAAAGTDFHVHVRNRARSSRTFTLSTFRMERFA